MPIEISRASSLFGQKGFKQRKRKNGTERRKRLARSGLMMALCCTIANNGILKTQRVAIAQADSVQSPLSNLEQFPLFPTLSTQPYRGQIVASDSLLSPTEIEQPSMSWIEEQIGNRYGSDRLVERWQAYRAPDSMGKTLNYVDVIVNEPIWGLLNYFERYAFISQFGSAAKYQGYNLRVFHSGDEQASLEANGTSIQGVRTAVLRGAYFCNFQAADNTAPEDIPCNIVLDESSLRTRRPFLSSP